MHCLLIYAVLDTRSWLPELIPVAAILRCSQSVSAIALHKAPLNKEMSEICASGRLRELSYLSELSLVSASLTRQYDSLPYGTTGLVCPTDTSEFWRASAMFDLVGREITDNPCSSFTRHFARQILIVLVGRRDSRIS